MHYVLCEKATNRFWAWNQLGGLSSDGRKAMPADITSTFATIDKKQGNCACSRHETSDYIFLITRITKTARYAFQIVVNKELGEYEVECVNTLTLRKVEERSYYTDDFDDACNTMTAMMEEEGSLPSVSELITRCLNTAHWLSHLSHAPAITQPELKESLRAQAKYLFDSVPCPKPA